MEAIILAGGLGKRLKDVVTDVPKPMALVAGKPFLEYLLHYLIVQGITTVVLSVGYKYELIQQYFGNNFKGVNLLYSIEKQPLGTGGAIKKSLQLIHQKNVFIVNGDTYFNIDLTKFLDHHQNSQAQITIALKPMNNFDRYGVVKMVADRVIGFEEKGLRQFGLINAGVYIACANMFDGFEFPDKFSFEIDFLSAYVQSIFAGGFVSDAYFIDIGIPEDYSRANLELSIIVQ